MSPLASDSRPEVGGLYCDENGNFLPINRDFVTATLLGNTQVVAAQGAGLRIRVLAVYVQATLAESVKFQSATTDITALFPLAATGGFVLPNNPHGWFQTNANEALNINLSLATSTACQMVWVQVS